jgi:hypothetical protein
MSADCPEPGDRRLMKRGYFVGYGDDGRTASVRWDRPIQEAWTVLCECGWWAWEDRVLCPCCGKQVRR